MSQVTLQCNNLNQPESDIGQKWNKKHFWAEASDLSFGRKKKQ